MATLEEITAQLTRLMRAKTGDAGASVREVTPLPGHAGFGYSFVLARTTAGGARGKHVVRVAPEGTRIAGPADVERQGRIMRSLANTEVPVPPILWLGSEPEFFGRPYFVGGFVEGFRLADQPPISREEGRALFRAMVATLAALHRVEWEPRREAWGDGPTAIADEMKRLDHLLDRDTLDPKTVARGPLLREKLRASIPATPRIGIVHGDFQVSNVLFKDGRVSAVLDWEISLLGPTLLDLGWLCFFNDPGAWTVRDLGRSPLTPDEIVETYAASARAAVAMDEVRWFRAFASFRFGVITCFNVMLHRRGKRHDPSWEDTALNAPGMFERGLELLG